MSVVKNSEVVITGCGLITSLSKGVESNFQALLEGQCAIQRMDEWDRIEGLKAKLAAIVQMDDIKLMINRQQRRTMSKMSEMTCLSAKEALFQAGLTPGELSERRAMIIVGSTTGSPITFDQVERLFYENQSTKGQDSTNVFKVMGHTAAVNLGHFLGFKGPIISPSAACSSGAQALILGKQMIESGAVDLVLAGGADECHFTSCMSFDLAYAASRKFTEQPQKASRPFDRDRDGIVVSEGASLMVLESEENRLSRGAKRLGHFMGGAYNADPSHMSQNSLGGITEAIELALENAHLSPKDIAYINAHATSTLIGDYREAMAVHSIFGDGMPISSLKGHYGHTFASCGVLEAAMCLKMLQTNQLVGTYNLENIDPELPPLDYITNKRNLDGDYIVSNNCAFGGINTSLVLGR